ncbi:MAG: cyclic nucleotide-binding domain-containing protein [Acidimicrobiales bacterium]|nr:cyclic nucleotide-binding domain-containing protein [Acidimicrobiales bacterium]MCB9392924.1 cyclic nucleotide-binding domain-containing protein [Acidimicrobiaceae bacterium]
MASKRVHVDHLKNVSLFRECTRKELEKIAARSDVIDLPAGRVLMHEGMPGSEAFVVLRGRVAVRRGGRKIAELADGAMVGELSLLDHGLRTATVDCLTECQLLVLTSGALLGCLDEVPSVAHKLMAALAGQLRNLDAKRPL